RGADADFERATDADPTFLPALRALARLREVLGEARAAAELYAREGRLTKAGSRAADAFRQAARLYANDGRDDQMAARCLEEVLALEPDAEVDFQVLEVILRARPDHDRLAQVMRRRAATGTPAQRRDRLLALADLLHQRDANEAAAALAEAAGIDSGDVPALLRPAEGQSGLGGPPARGRGGHLPARGGGLARPEDRERGVGAHRRHRRARSRRRGGRRRRVPERAAVHARRHPRACRPGPGVDAAARLRERGDHAAP